MLGERGEVGAGVVVGPGGDSAAVSVRGELKLGRGLNISRKRFVFRVCSGVMFALVR
jgi:hypothetical protein